MIKKWILTGDTHGDVISRLENIKLNSPEYIPEETGVIILGDAGLNYWGNKTDKKNKKATNDCGYVIYCVRGNHEMRPTDVPGMQTLFDENVNGLIHMEEEYPNIKYFIEGGSYVINDYNVLTIGGAYSVDKYWRLSRAEAAGRSFSGWFWNEQLDDFEREKITEYIRGNEYDFVFSHTCPYEWEPTDLFLSIVDQSTVDNSMEHWLSDLREEISYNIWCFGHYHADRMERPHVEQYYKYYENIDIIFERWKKYDETGQLDPYIQKSPYFYD